MSTLTVKATIEMSWVQIFAPVVYTSKKCCQNHTGLITSPSLLLSVAYFCTPSSTGKNKMKRHCRLQLFFWNWLRLISRISRYRKIVVNFESFGSFVNFQFSLYLLLERSERITQFKNQLDVNYCCVIGCIKKFCVQLAVTCTLFIYAKPLVKYTLGFRSKVL